MKAIKIEKEDIKELVTIDMVLELYGIPLTKGKYKRCRCPFHEEKTPSFDVSADGKVFYCFGCAKSGDVLDLAKKLSGITYMPELLIFLNDRFNLDLTSNKSSKEIQKKIKEREERQEKLERHRALQFKRLQEILAELKKLDTELIVIDDAIDFEQKKAKKTRDIEYFTEIISSLFKRKFQAEQRIYYLELEQEEILNEKY